MRIATSTAILCCLPFVAGCSTSGPVLDKGIPVEQAAGLRATAPRDPSTIVLFEEQTSSGHSKLHQPVIQEARVFAVWIPEHVDQVLDVKIGGHWVYFRLAEARWVVPGQQRDTDADPNPPVTDPSRPDAVLPSLNAQFQRSQWVVPYRTETPPQKKREEGNDAEWK